MSEPISKNLAVKKKELLALAITALFGAAIVALPWFSAPGYLFFTDFNWGPHKSVSLQGNGAPFFLLLEVLGKVLGTSLAEKAMVVSCLLLLVVAGMKLAAALTQDVKIRALVGLYVLFNPFVYERLGYGQINLLVGLAFFTMGAAELLSAALNEKKERFMLWSALWFGLALQFSPHFLFFIIAIGLACLVPLAREGL